MKYNPPLPAISFSQLTIVFTSPIDESEAEEVAIAEAFIWLNEFPLPTAVYCEDMNGDNFSVFSGSFSCYFWWNKTGTVDYTNSIEESKEFFEGNSVDHAVFSEIPFRTQSQIEEQSSRNFAQKMQSSENLKLILAVTEFVFPVAILIFSTFLSPTWFTVFVFVFSLIAPIKRLRSIYQKPTRKINNKYKRDQMIKEYIYHCDRNPSGFLRLKLENLREDEQNRIQQESAEIGSKQSR